jgi:flagellar hook-associated protein 1 FlgK
MHTQGAGLEKLTYALGTYRVHDPSFPLGETYSGLPWNNRLQEGNFSIAIFDPLTGKPIMVEPGMSTAISINFDPATDSLQDVINNINATTIDWTDSLGVLHVGDPLSNFIDLSIVDNKLQISSVGGYGFGFTDDTTGLLAGLGINTFFKGSTSADIAIRDDIMQNNNLVNAGRINGAAELNSGDGIIARDIGRLVDKVVNFRDWTGHNNRQTLGNFYGTLVTTVGSYSANAQFNYRATATVAKELEDRQSEVAGVNLDEEMAALIKYQASYKAAAKLITTADQMFQTLLGLKQ